VICLRMWWLLSSVALFSVKIISIHNFGLPSMR